MPQQAQPFTCFIRKNRKFFTVRFRLPDNTFLERCSQQTSLSATKNWALKKYTTLLAEFQRANDVLEQTRNQDFASYAKQFFDFEQSSWIKAKLARGGHYSRRAAHSASLIVAKHIIPHFGTCKLGSITVSMIEDWLLDLPSKAGISKATANRIYTFLRSMIKEMYRRNIIENDPTLRVQQFSVAYEKRGILTTEEVHKLFASLDPWKGNTFHVAINMLAATTALRVGEIQALRWCDIKSDQIRVMHSWSELDGLKLPKSNITRTVPIIKRVHDILMLIKPSSATPFDLVFPGIIDSQHPIDKKAVLKHLRQALVFIGISLEDQKSRALCFHSWRHFAATYLRRQAPDHEVRAMTGHADSRMLDLYSAHSTQVGFAAIAAAQESLIG